MQNCPTPIQKNLRCNAQSPKPRQNCIVKFTLLQSVEICNATLSRLSPAKFPLRAFPTPSQKNLNNQKFDNRISFWLNLLGCSSNFFGCSKHQLLFFLLVVQKKDCRFFFGSFARGCTTSCFICLISIG